MNKEQRESLLIDVYKHQVENGMRFLQINRDLSKDEEYRSILKIVEYWEQKGILEYTVRALGFTGIKLTAYGIDYVEESLV